MSGQIEPIAAPKSATWQERFWVVFFISGLFALLILSFINCEGGAPNGGLAGLRNQADDTPFAFEAKLDHMAYMSCSEMGADSYNAEAFFTFRAGAYESGSGLRLNSEFIDYAKSLSEEQMRRYLQDSPTNDGATLELAVRSGESVHSIFMAGNTARKSFDYSFMLAPLVHPYILSQLLDASEQAEFIRYIRGLPGTGQRSMEASISFLESEAMANYLRTQMSAGAQLALTYTAATVDDETLARTPAEFVEGAKDDEFEKVWGTGYRMSFQPFNVNNSSSPQRVLRSIEPIDLLEQRARFDEKWSCPNDQVFVIVQPEDADDYCPLVADPVETPVLRRLRHLVKVENWYVNMDRGCVVPKKPGNCYGSLDYEVQYDLAQPCGQGTPYHCAHFLSVCHREVN